MKNLKYLIILLVFVMGCKEKITEPTNSYSVKGKVVDSNGPVSKAKVAIDNYVNWETTTDVNGDFEIRGVTKGEHSLSYSYNDTSGAFVESNANLEVNEDVILNSLKLPIPPKLYLPSSIGITSLTLNWNLTDAGDFREYKLFRNDGPGLDETTGELIYVGTSRSDTLFTDNDIPSGKTYYHRVYIMNEYGRLGGSNIVSATTLRGNLIPDGDFENMTDIDSNWSIASGGATFGFTDSTKKSGVYSLQGKLTDQSVHLKGIKPIKLSAGVTYEMSGWFKAYGKTTGTNEWMYFEIFEKQYDPTSFGENLSVWSDSPNFDVPADIEWTYVSKVFTPTKDVTVFFQIFSGIENFWFDDLKIIVK